MRLGVCGAYGLSLRNLDQYILLLIFTMGLGKSPSSRLRGQIYFDCGFRMADILPTEHLYTAHPIQHICRSREGRRAFTRREACSLIPTLVAGTGIPGFIPQDDS